MYLALAAPVPVDLGGAGPRVALRAAALAAAAAGALDLVLWGVSKDWAVGVTGTAVWSVGLAVYRGGVVAAARHHELDQGAAEMGRR